MSRKLTHEEIVKRVAEINPNIKITGQCDGSNKPVSCECMKCGFNTYPDGRLWMPKPNNILHGSGCPRCSGRVVYPGKTDIATVAPWMIELLADKDDAYRYTFCSHQIIDFKCKDCGRILPNRIQDIYNYQHLTCPTCSDGVSYPNKVMGVVLKNLNISYLREYKIDRHPYRYDFYIPHIETIVEMHGAQHYDEWTLGDVPLEDRRIIDKIKRDLAIQNGVKKYIIIDCRNTDFNYIKNNIMESDLSELINMYGIDWKKCEMESCKSFVVKSAEMYNEGMRIGEIAKQLSLSVDVIRKYLKQATSAGLCTYVPDCGGMKRTHDALCLNDMIVYTPQTCMSVYGVYWSNVFACCKGNLKTAGKDPKTGERLKWVFADEYNTDYIDST